MRKTPLYPIALFFKGLILSFAEAFIFARVKEMSISVEASTINTEQLLLIFSDNYISGLTGFDSG